MVLRSPLLTKKHQFTSLFLLNNAVLKIESEKDRRQNTSTEAEVDSVPVTLKRMSTTNNLFPITECCCFESLKGTDANNSICQVHV